MQQKLRVLHKTFFTGKIARKFTGPMFCIFVLVFTFESKKSVLIPNRKGDIPAQASTPF